MEKDLNDFGIMLPLGVTGQVRTTCPQCSYDRKKTNDKCLAVNVEEGTWFCHHCGWSGGLGKNGRTGIPRQEMKIEKPYIVPDTLSMDDLAPSIIKWFKEERCIPESVLRRNRIRHKVAYMTNEGKEVVVIAFPFFKQDKIVNIKYRSKAKSFKQESGGEKIFYGLDDISPNETELIIVEGEIDKLSLEVAGYCNCLSVPDGAPPIEAKTFTTKFDFIKNSETALGGYERFKKIIIAVDNDAPGKKLEDELIRRFGPERCWIVEWPEGCKDANDVLKNLGEFFIKRQIQAAKPVPVAGLFDIESISKDVDALYADGLPGGVSTGWFNFDDFYTVRPGEMTIVTGMPGHGKSAFVDALLVNLAMFHNWGFAVFSPENQPLQRHAAKIAQLFTGKPFGTGPTPRMDTEELKKAKDWMQERFFFILPKDDELTIDSIISKAKVAVRRHGVRGVVLDPWNEIDHSRPPGLSETEYISKCLTVIRRFARTYGVHVWIVAHPFKMTKDKDSGKYPVPTPYDISGSAHWRNKADNCLTIFRNEHEEKGRVEVYIQKIRFREVGKIGMVEFLYDVVSGRYNDDVHIYQKADKEYREIIGVP